MSGTVIARMLLSVLVLVSYRSAADDFAGKANELLARVVREENLVGVSGAVARDGQIVWAGAAGFANLENKVPASPEMVHRIASVSKAMTAVAAMRLVEQGKLKLDVPVQTYVPDFPKKEWEITCAHLLTHTSGIPHYHKAGQAVLMTNFPTLQSALAEFSEAPLKFEPGSQFLYTTFGYTLLGAALEKAGGKPFAAIMKENVWEPAGMKSTRLEMQEEIVPGRSSGYARVGHEIVNARYTDLSVKYPGGGMLSTVEDMLRFAIAFDKGELVSLETRDRMLRETTLNDGSTSVYGIGWLVGEFPPFGRYYRHDGNQPGTSAELTVFVDKHVAVALISNLYRTNDALRQTSRELVALATGLTFENVDAEPAEKP